MNKPVISVVVCTYNRADLLPGCLQSLAEQTLDKSLYEIIVINNNSTDATQEMAEGFTARYPNFRVVVETKQGLSHARNRGYMEARGEYAAYIDDDARADKGWIEGIIDFTKRHPEVVAFGGPYTSFSLVDVPKWYKESYGSWSLGERERPIDKTEWINGTNMVFKKPLLIELGGFHTGVGMSGNTISYGEETNLLIKVKDRNLPVYYVPGIVVEHLVADYKMSLGWMIKSFYMSGFSALETFNLKRRPGRRILVTAYLFFKGLILFVFSRERYIKTRVLDSFSAFFNGLGLTVRMFKG